MDRWIFIITEHKPSEQVFLHQENLHHDDKPAITGARPFQESRRRGLALCGCGKAGQPPFYEAKSLRDLCDLSGIVAICLMLQWQVSENVLPDLQLAVEEQVT